VEFRILGPLEVVDDGRVVEFGAGRQSALVAVLILNRNQVVATDALVEALWGAAPPATATKSVRNAVSLLRKELGSRVATRAPGYVLTVEPGELDADRVEALMRAAQGQEPGRAAESLREALGLFRGRPLAEVGYESFAQAEIRRLEELQLACVEERIDADLALGRHGVLVPELEALVKEHPLRERLRGQLMLALYRCGRQAEALEAYRQARSALIDGLGIEPSRGLQDLELRILNQDEALEAPAERRSDDRSRHRRRGALALVAGAILLLAGAAAAAVVELTGGGTAGLRGVARDSVGVIDPGTGKIVGQIAVGSSPTRVAAGPDGLWVVNQGDATVSRIDYRTHAVRTISAPETPTAVAAGADAVWLLSGSPIGGTDPTAGPAEISKIAETPSVSVLATVPLGSQVGNDFEDPVAAGPGAVWAADPGVLTRINAETLRKTGRYPVVSSTPQAIAVADGSVWVLDEDGLIRVDPRTGEIVARIQAGVQPVGLAAAGGAIWVVSRSGQSYTQGAMGQIGHSTLTDVDPTTNTATTTIELPGRPTAVAAGGGSVWVSDDPGKAVIDVDARTGRIRRIVYLGSRPEGIAFADGRVWVATQ
jgi:DNA-binding SARP family transcriptional activator/streptogramin lyase